MIDYYITPYKAALVQNCILCMQDLFYMFPGNLKFYWTDPYNERAARFWAMHVLDSTAYNFVWFLR